MNSKQFFTLIVIRLIGLLIAIVLLLLLCIGWVFSRNKDEYWKGKRRSSPPPCLVSSSYGRHSFIQLKTIKLHYVECGNRKNPLMLCLHGFPEFWYSWKYQMEAFSKTHWVVAVDLRGYGQSEKPKGVKHYTLPILIEDVRQLIEGLGRETCVLLGHDWGGLLGWCFAAKYPNMLTHYVALNCPHPFAFQQFVRRSFKQMLFSWYMYYFQTPWIPELGLRSMDHFIMDTIAKAGLSPDADCTEEIEAYKYPFSQPGAWKPPVNYYRNIFGSESFFWKSSHYLRVRVPSLLIFGKKDPALSYHMVPESEKYCDSFQYHFIEDSEHWVQREKPQQVNSKIAEFLQISL